MRIISGTYGGRRFEAPRNLQARPTTDLAKESLFNILQNRIDFDGITALDLFGGTGSITFELLSRGASQVTCVELAHQQQQFIRKVADTLHIGHELNLVRGDVFKFLKSQAAISSGDGRYDLVFADPPYALPELDTLPALVLDNQLLKTDGIFILEHGKDQDFTHVAGYQETRKYGAVHFSIFHRP